MYGYSASVQNNQLQLTAISSDPGVTITAINTYPPSINEYSNVLAQLQKSANSAIQSIAWSNLPSPQNNPFASDTLLLTTAQEKALGLPASGGLLGEYDGIVGIMNNNELSESGYIGNWTGSNSAQLNMLAVIEHETSEVMGRLAYDGTTPTGTTFGPSYTLMDLFRYVAPPPAINAAYFSIDGGKQAFDVGSGLFNNLQANGDLGDWINGPIPNDAFGPAALGNASISATDFMLMNVLGWNVNVTDSWSVGSSGDFATGSNWKPLSPWSSGIAPGPAINAQITASGIYTVTSSSDAYVNSLATATGVTLAINDGTFSIMNGTGTGANAGTIAVADGASLSVGGTFKNTGTIGLESVFVPTSLLIAADVDLQGDGNLTLSDSNQNTVAAAVGAGPVTLTNVGNTISGSGVLGTGDGTLSLVNDKVIEATGTINGLVIDTGNAVTNSGKLEATGPAGLTLDDTVDNTSTGGVYAAATGAVIDLENDSDIDGGKVTIVAGALFEATGGSDTLAGVTVSDKGILEATLGSTLTLANTTVNASGGIIEAYDEIEVPPLNSGVVLSNATISGGTLTTADGGEIATAPGTNSTLSGVTISTGNTVTITDGSTLTLKGTINNDGTIALNSTGDPTDLMIAGNVALQGGGNATLTDNADNYIVSNGSTAKLMNVDTISGAGTIGDSNLTLVNKGTIDASGTNPLFIDTGTNTISSPGTLEATNGGTLIVDSPVVKSGTGTATINNGTMDFRLPSNINVTFGSNTGGGYSFTTIDRGSQFSGPTGINNVGQIVGNYYDLASLTSYPFVYSDGQDTYLTDLAGYKVNGINDFGQVTAYYSYPSFVGSIYSSAVTPINLGSASAINDAGDVVGYETLSLASG